MKYRVLGVQNVDYVSKRTGNPVKGVTLHCCAKDVQVIGEAVYSVYISDNLGLPSGIVPGVTVDVEYNNRGHVAGVELVSKN